MHETIEDYTYMFSQLKTTIKRIFDVNYEPVILLADCAAEITAGFSAVFELLGRIFCWAHVERAIETHIGAKCQFKESILNDIRLFQHHTEVSYWDSY